MRIGASDETLVAASAPAAAMYRDSAAGDGQYALVVRGADNRLYAREASSPDAWTRLAGDPFDDEPQVAFGVTGRTRGGNPLYAPIYVNLLRGELVVTVTRPGNPVRWQLVSDAPPRTMDMVTIVPGLSGDVYILWLRSLTHEEAQRGVKPDPYLYTVRWNADRQQLEAPVRLQGPDVRWPLAGEIQVPLQKTTRPKRPHEDR
jgi:hypothetical protein